MKMLIALCCISTSILAVDFRKANALSYSIKQLLAQLETSSKQDIKPAEWDQWALPAGQLLHDMTNAVSKKTRVNPAFQRLKEAISTVAIIAKQQSQAPVTIPDMQAVEQAQKELYQAWHQLRPAIDSSTALLLRSIVELFGNKVIVTLQKTI